jgi:hypothetical protein
MLTVRSAPRSRQVIAAQLKGLTRPSAVLFLCLFASQAARLVLSPILPEIAREFDVSTATAGQLRPISGATGGLSAVAPALSRRCPGLRDLRLATERAT